MARKGPHKRVAELRDTIATLKQRRREISAAPVADAEIETALSEFIERRAAEYRVKRIAEPLARKGRINSLGARNIEAFACFYFGDQIRQTLLAHVPKSDGLARADRHKQLAAIDDELFAAECAEEAAIVDSEDNGQPIERRGDADPRAVLHATEGDD